VNWVIMFCPLVKGYRHLFVMAKNHTTLGSRIVVLHSEGPLQRGDSMGATENAGFSAKVQRNLGLDFVTKQHKSLQKRQPVYSLVEVTC